MIELLIDGQRCDIAAMPTIPIDFDIEKLTTVEGERSGRIVEFDIPFSPKNDAILGSSRDIYATQRFNSEHHTAVLKRDGVELFAGTVYLRGTTLSEGGGDYSLRISEGGAEWIERVVYNKLSDLDIPFEGELFLDTIVDSWEGDGAVKFFPVRRDENRFGYSSESALPIEFVMLTDDYHPFISIAEMVRAMFAKSGYQLRSNFFDSEFGQSLYMSGDYMREDVSEAKSKCDFLARLASPKSSTADFFGRVYASNHVATHSIGPLVDTVDPEALNSRGEQMADTFNTLNAFSFAENGDICFTPSCSVKAGFMLHLEYTTDYKILSRNNFKGFNVFEGASNLRVEFPLANMCKDLREKLLANMQYRALVFDHTSGRSYRLMAQYGDGRDVKLAEWSARSSLIETQSVAPPSVALLYRDSAEESWRPYTEDWAIYSGYIEEEGRVDVVLDVRVPHEEVSAGESIPLDKFWFSGAESGMGMTLGIGTYMRPYFTTVPGYGAQLEFKDVASRQIRQVDLLIALGEMFNLAFYTDRALREVHIEPLEEFYDESEVVDIDERINRKGGIRIADTGLDMAQTHRFAYLEGDVASEKFNRQNDTVLGAWSYYNHLYGTKDSERELGGRIFTTTVNVQNVVSFAPSASIMRVGDKSGSIEGSDAPFTPHIVCYKGVRHLPENECWIAHQKLDRYPYVAFVDEEDINLGFEDRNGIEGLNRFHKPELMRQEEGQRVTLELYLTTAEVASLFTESGPKPSVRKLFRFGCQGERSLYRIVRVEGWSVDKGCVRCTFERIAKDEL